MVADAAAFERARRPKPSKLAANAELRGVVADKLDDDWSPQQIAQWLRREYLGDAAMRISHESIYRDLYMPSRKVFDASMFHRLRSGRSIRRPRGKKPSHGRGQIRNTVSIRERPVEADTREVAGHWEGDLVYKRAHRRSPPSSTAPPATPTVVALPDGNKADAVARTLIDHLGQLPADLRRSLTWDRGSEMAHHAVITTTLSLPVFFCDPHHPWQRDQREHEPAATPIPTQERRPVHVHSRRAQHAAAKLNQRPRRVLGWATPGWKIRRCRTLSRCCARLLSRWGCRLAIMTRRP